ncbi:peptidase [Neobacillus cucumis]|uniref:Peptidase n=1 Tax=Neobacillus cucumis TaxID=1740721 RepID=A0A2N5HNM4_9BACI|nr:peptidase [Neobacillus cucumis]
MIKKVLILWGISIFLSTAGVDFSKPIVHAEVLGDLHNKPSLPPSVPSSNLNNKFIQVSKDIEENTAAIQEADQNQKKLQVEIEKLEKDIDIIKGNLEKRTTILKQRALAYQRSDQHIAYLEVLLGSTSLSDFFNRVGAVAAIADADQELIKQQENEQRKFVYKKESLNNKLTVLAQLKDNLKKRKTYLEKQQAEYKQIAMQAEREVPQDSQPNITVPVKSKNGYIHTVTNAGKKYIGKSVYVFGGGRTAYDIANGRFDCSGFVHWAFAQAGINIGQNTDSIKREGREISSANMQPGDLVFFDTYKKDGHVGIYIGNGKFIGSQSSTGVAIADMKQGYWKETFNGRVIRI